MMLTPYTFAEAIAPIPPARAMPEPALCMKTTARPTTRNNLLISLLLSMLSIPELVSRTYRQGTFQGCFRACPKRKLRWGADLDRQILPSGSRTLKKRARLTYSCVVDLTVTLSSG